MRNLHSLDSCIIGRYGANFHQIAVAFEKKTCQLPVARLFSGDYGQYTTCVTAESIGGIKLRQLGMLSPKGGEEMRKVLVMLLCLGILTVPAEAAIRWVDFDLSCEAMERALELEIRGREQENPHSWIEILALAAAQHNGNPTATEVRQRGTA